MTKRYYPTYGKDRDYKTNAPSYYEFLAKVNVQLKNMEDKFNSYDEELASSIKEMKDRIEEELRRIVDGDYLTDQYLESLELWIDRNLTDIVSRIAKIVWFGLNDDGYFIAVIPDSWSTINFDTTEEGNLMLVY